MYLRDRAGKYYPKISIIAMELKLSRSTAHPCKMISTFRMGEEDGYQQNN
jgi:hypothetical protein